MGNVNERTALTDTEDAWIHAQIGSGRDTNESQHTCDLIRHEQENLDHIPAIRNALIEGVNSGPFETFDLEEFKQRMKKPYY